MEFYPSTTHVTETQINAAEARFGIKLPPALRNMILAHNGAILKYENWIVSKLISFSDADAMNVFNLDEWYEIPSGYLPFADDGEEGYLALSGEDGTIAHFRWGEAASRETVAASFAEFLKRLDQPEEE